MKRLRYALHAEPRGGGAAAATHRLHARTLQDAKLEAAIVFACAEELPAGYRIVRGAEEVVYRYPEAAAATD